MRALLFAASLVALALAGCAAPAAEELPPESGDAVLSADTAPFDLVGTDCLQGGGHSVHPRSLWESGTIRVVPDPWVPADVWDDVGEQVTWSEIPDPQRPIPEKGNTMGNYHATMWCASWTFGGTEKPDLFVGFVGMKVEAPDFGAEDSTHDYVVTVIATNDDEVNAALEAGGIRAMKASATREQLPDGSIRMRMQTDRNGDYDSLFTPVAHGAMEATLTRLWWQQPLDGDHAHEGGEHGAHAEGAFRPVALDLHAEGGNHFVAAGQGYFSHSGTEHHAPLPGAYGHTAAILYTGFDVRLAWGPANDVMLTSAYVH